MTVTNPPGIKKPVPTIVGGTATGQVYVNALTYPIFVAFRPGVISAPNQNGHIYFDIRDPADPIGTVNGWVSDTGAPGWLTIAFIGCRNQSLNNDAVSSGGTLMGVVAPGYQYGFTLQTIAGFAAPTFVNESSNRIVTPLATGNA